MSKDHIIPRFILRNFAIDPTANKKALEVKIYDRTTKQVFVQNIHDAFALEDFNSPETEQYLANEYESKVAQLFQRITQATNNDQTSVTFSISEYRMLFRFFTIMWRRNDIHMKEAEKISLRLESTMKMLFGDQYHHILAPEYEGVPFDKLLSEKSDIRTGIYDTLIRTVKNNDPTVIKTINNYNIFIVHNKSKIHFLLHNTYGTLIYMMPKNRPVVCANDMPIMMIYPISKTLCFCLTYSEKRIDATAKSFDIPIENLNDEEEVKEIFIKKYITKSATSFAVDETNMDFVRI